MSWIPLMDYAVKKGVSLSTLRRYIKAKKVQYQVDAGKYLLWDEEDDRASQQQGMASIAYLHPQQVNAADFTAIPHWATQRMEALEHELCLAKEEIAELKMLIELYEEKMLITNAHC